MQRVWAGRDVIVQIGDVFQTVAPPSAAALHQLPPPPGDFTGRKAELEELMEAIEKGGVTISGLRGMGGIGKTALALKLAHQLRERYPDAQIYLDLKGTSEKPLTTAEAMAHAVRAYRPTAHLPDNEAELAGIYRFVLDGQRALLLMDNAVNAAQVGPLAPPASCLLLVTARQRFILRGWVAKDLGTLAPEEARALLLRLAPRVGGAAGEIARLCGYLPLALCAAGGMLASCEDLPPRRYAEQLLDERQRLERLGKEGVEISVEASFNLSYASLEGEAARVFRQLAVFPGSFDAAAEEVVCKDLEHARLSELLRRSLVEYDSAGERYRLHDLTHLFAASRRSDQEGDEAERRHAARYLEVASAADDLYLKGGDAILVGLRLFDTEWANIRAGQVWAAAHAEEDQQAAKLCSTYPSAVVVLPRPALASTRTHQVAGSCVGCGAAVEGPADGRGALGEPGHRLLAIGRAALRHRVPRKEACHRAGNGRPPGRRQRPGQPGLGVRRLGRATPRHRVPRADLAIAREIGDRRGEGAALGNLGLAYADWARCAAPSNATRKRWLLSVRLGIVAAKAKSWATSAARTPSWASRAAPWSTTSRRWLLTARLGIGAAKGGTLATWALPTHWASRAAPSSTKRRGWPSCARSATGRAKRRPWATWALPIRTGRAAPRHRVPRAGVGYYRGIGDRHGEGQGLGNLGNAYQDLGDPRRAIEYHERYLAIAREVGDRRGEGNALFNMSLALDQLGDRPHAIVNAEAALKIYVEIEDPYAESVRRQLAGWGA